MYPVRHSLVRQLKEMRNFTLETKGRIKNLELSGSHSYVEVGPLFLTKPLPLLSAGYSHHMSLPLRPTLFFIYFCFVGS